MIGGDRAGRLTREPLERRAPAAPAILRDEATTESFRRKIEAMAADEPMFDLSSSEETPATERPWLRQEELIRAVILNEILAPPQSRRRR